MSLHYQPRLDHLRFFAATLVVLFHFSRNQGWSDQLFSGGFEAAAANVAWIWLRKGFTGVSFFLVLSGFLLCVICQAGQKKIQYSTFIYNRILRIYPLLVCLFFIVICLTWRESGPLDILRLLTAQFNTGNPQGTGWGYQAFPVGSIWTLAVEFQFYLIFPFLALFLHTHGVRYLLGLILVMILSRYGIAILRTTDMAAVAASFHHSIIGRLDQFLLGMLLGYLCVHDNGTTLFRHSIVKVCCFLAGILGLTVLLYCHQIIFENIHFAVLFPTMEAALWSVILYGYYTISMNIPKIIDSTLAKLGKISYSIYLLHEIVGKYIIKTGNILSSESIHGFIPLASAIILATIALSFLTYAIIEQPFLSLKKKYC